MTQQWQEVERNSLGILAHDATWVRTARVEVSQQSTIPLLEWLTLLLRLGSLRVDVVRDDFLNHALCSPVWVCWANWAVFGDWDHVGHLGRIVAVDSGRGGEDDIGDIVLDHAAE